MSLPDPETGGFTMYGPELTFLGVPRADLRAPASLAGADVVVVGAPSTAAPATGPGPGSAPRPSAAPTTWATTAPGRRSPWAWTPSGICGWSTSATW
jgi:hypothetical protein